MRGPSEQACDPIGCGCSEHLLTGTGLKHMAILDHDHVTGEQRRLLGVVRHKHSRDSGLELQTLQLQSQLLTHRTVERRERLVEQQQLRLVRQCTASATR